MAALLLYAFKKLHLKKTSQDQLEVISISAGAISLISVVIGVAAFAKFDILNEKKKAIQQAAKGADDRTAFLENAIGKEDFPYFMDKYVEAQGEVADLSDGKEPVDVQTQRVHDVLEKKLKAEKRMDLLKKFQTTVDEPKLRSLSKTLAIMAPIVFVSSSIVAITANQLGLSENTFRSPKEELFISLNKIEMKLKALRKQ